MKTLSQIMKDSANIGKLMENGNTDKLDYHILQTINDEYTRDVYLILLLSVVKVAEPSESDTDGMLSYVCKIATSLKSTPDMEELFRRSLLTDENMLQEYAQTMKQYGIQLLLIFDSLTYSSLPIILLTPKSSFHNPLKDVA